MGVRDKKMQSVPPCRLQHRRTVAAPAPGYERQTLNAYVGNAGNLRSLSRSTSIKLDAILYSRRRDVRSASELPPPMFWFARTNS